MKNIICRTIIVTVLTFFSVTTVASADPLAIPPDGFAETYGFLADFYKCWDKKLGTKVSLQVKENGTWKTVASSQLRRNRVLCPANSTARYKWTIDVLGVPYKTKCGVTTYLLEFREFFPADKSIGSVWTQQEYASKADGVKLIGAVLDERILGIKC